MIATLIYGRKKQEVDVLLALEKDLAALAGDERWSFALCSTLRQVREHFLAKPLLDMLCYEITQGEALAFLEEIRRDYPVLHLLLVADKSLSPMAYLRPGIMANSLLLRPWSVEQARDVLAEFVASFLEKTKGALEGRAYVVESREGKTAVPYGQIYYFESREKKIYVCTGNEEIGFYHTIEELLGELPEGFARCHRSFIVNVAKIRKVMLSRNMLMLCDGFEVPLSRSYKAAFKGFGK